MRRFTDILSRPLNRLQRRFERSRPGSILIFVIALLVLLALMGTAYIATARQDRFAAAAGNSGDDINRELANALQQAIDDVTASVTQDVSPVTCATPGFDSTVAPSLYLASRAPYLDMHPSDTTTKTLQPTWATISRTKGRKYEAIYVDTLNNKQAQYDFTGLDAAPAALTSGGSPSSTPRAAWHIVPTNIVITYSAGKPGTSSALDGRTYVYPAFIRWRYGSDPTALPVPSPDTNHVVTEGPFIAADATGWGVADAAMFKLNSTKSLTYYAGIRVVDNASGINVNTAWDPAQDADFNTPANAFNFFPSDVDLHGLLYMLNNATTNATNEMRGINFFRLRNGWNGTAPAAAALPAPDRETGGTRTDMKWRNAADAKHMEYDRRLNFPNRRWGDTTATKLYARTYDAPDQPYADTAALAYRGVLTNQSAALSYFETEVLRFIDAAGTNLNRADSFDRATMNFTTNPTNEFSFVPANNVGYWYDWNFDSDNTPSLAATSRVIFPIAATNNIGARMDGVGGLGGFRTPRGLVVGSNPVRNLPPQMLNNLTLGTNIIASGAIALDTMPSWANAPHKTSLNTAGFGELWRAYWNVMAESPINGDPLFHVPGVDASGPKGADGAKHQFTNPLRDPLQSNSDPSTGRSNGTPSSAKLRLDAYNTLLLRSAIAAVNTMNFRDSSNMQGTNKIGLPRQKDIKLSAIGVSGPVGVTVHVYGNEAQPFITEVFAHTNIDKSQDSATTGKINPKGYVAVQLYNPYPVTLDLSQYTLWYVDRKSTGAYPNLNYQPIKLTTPLTTLAPNTYLTLENFDPASGAGNGTTDASYRPSYVTGDQAAHPDMVTVRELYKVLEDPADPSVGGELVIMRPSDRSVTPPSSLKDVVPVDSYDFSGLKLMVDPKLATAPPPANNTATAWHYFRASGNTTATSWKCVYPGRYNATATGKPRHEGTKIEPPWDTTNAEPWVTAPPVDFKFTPGGQATPCYPNPFPGIRLNNDMFSRSSKFNANPATGNIFPFGGFARVGDVEMIPFIGAYTIEPTGGTTPTAGFLAAEANAISIDSSFADDGDTGDDAYENIGRFCPLRDPNAAASPGGFDDYGPYGTYLGQTNPPASPTGSPLSKWTYRWAMDVFDNFTTVSNPQDDFLPNIAPTTVLDQRGWPGTTPDAIPNGPTARGTTPAATTINSGKEDLKPVEGLINVNSAPWQVLSRIQWYPPAAPAPAGFPSVAAYNQQIAQWIVRYRDVDGGTNDTNGDPIPHGPFVNLLELNGVFQGAIPGGAPADKTKTLRNAFGALPTGAMPDAKWGNYAVDSGVAAFPSIAGQLGADFANDTIMVTRVSNLLTTRSDSFTAYVVVQGWRNVGTPWPELVVQRRAALVLDRSGSIPGGSNNSVLSYSVPSK